MKAGLTLQDYYDEYDCIELEDIFCYMQNLGQHFGIASKRLSIVKIAVQNQDKLIKLGIILKKAKSEGKRKEKYGRTEKTRLEK